MYNNIMSYRISQCIFCKHFNHKHFNCNAFPKAIPSTVFNNIHRHNNIYPGDNGITFEPGTNEDLKMVNLLFQELEEDAKLDTEFEKDNEAIMSH